MEAEYRTTTTTTTTFHNDTSERWLAAAEKDEGQLDYSVLSVAVLTLALLLFVEVLRHKLDSEAAFRPFFKVVLEATYSELVTLGLVELFVFLALRYYEVKYKERKEVFAEVHFALFYTAIFNAFQSVICGIFTRRVSKAMWVQTEQLELDHYVEIREAFDRVSKEYNDLRESQKNWTGLQSCFLAWRQPGLRRRFMKLLVQVRFHELRIQFLESNNLPLTLKVSDYLKRSEESVLMHMVHVSGTAWLLLTGGLNLIYFVEGLVGNLTQDHTVVSNTMTGIFFGMLIFFIVICMVLYFKMRSVFERILKMKPMSETDSDLGSQAQRQLFWFSEPQLVISIIQFMQFGYAIALSIVIMFWTDLGEIEAYWYLFATLGCYALFVFVLSRVLPQYTLCTSLGHLVNQKHLNETLAMHRLHEAQRKQKRRMVQVTFDQGIRDDSIVRLTTDRDKNEKSIALEVNHTSTTANASSASKSMAQSGSSSELSSSMVHSVSSQTANSAISNRTQPQGEPRQATRSSDLSALLAELVKMDTSALRSQLSAHDVSRVVEREQRQLNRTKALSDGVQAMRAMSGFSTAAMTVDSVDDSDISPEKREQLMAARRASRKQSILALLRPEGLANTSGPTRRWSMVKEAHDDVPRATSSPASEMIQQEPRSIDGGADDGINKAEDPSELHSRLKRQRLQATRQSRRKSVSASAVIESWRHPSRAEEAASCLPQMEENLWLRDDEHENSSKLESSSLDLNMDFNELVRTVNLLDAKLDREATAPITKKSVGFSDGRSDPPEDDDSLIFAPKASKDDGATLDTNSSVGDLSDVGAPMLEFESLRSLPWEESWYAKHVKKFNLGTNKKVLRNFLLSDTHAVASHVFGSFVVFFLIGMRLEAFNTVTGAFDPSYNTWELRLDIAFWLQVTLYILFIVMSALTMWVVNPSECKSIGEKRAFASALMDMVLSTLCLTLLFVADGQRCCEDASEMPGLERLLADASKKSWIDDPVYQECCPFWGFRTFGGYGSIEPFTALIGLRVLRFQLAKVVIQQRSTDEKSSADQDKLDEHHKGGHHGQSSGFGHGSEKESILEHWQRAINQHPHIVEKYGQFSGELFQAMLGLEIIEDEGHTTKSDELANPTSTISGSVGDLKEPSKAIEAAPHYKLSKRYSTLSTECQGIILAGQLGKPVKSMSTLPSNIRPIDSNVAVLSEERTIMEGEQMSTIDVEFQVDASQLAAEQDYDSIFIAPNARLTRSMRRCDRRLVPLLMDWTTVDVVMTDYELVYFEVLVDHESALSPELRRKRESLQLALQATRGGKGLRLIDVAAGRKVVGHLDLSEVTQIHVERDMPIRDVSHLEAKEANLDVTKHILSEYWQRPSHTEILTESRTLRWAKVKEDRLKLVSAQGTLYLRYYSDLDDVEARRLESEAEDELEGVLKKDIALQWAQTIVHICGKDKLKQQLPNYGTNDSEELRDYLEVVYHKSDDTRAHRRHSTFAGGLPRGLSRRDLMKLPRNRNSVTASFRRSYSSTSERVVLDRTKSLRFFNRSASDGPVVRHNRNAMEDIEVGRRGTVERTGLKETPKLSRFIQRSTSLRDPRREKSDLSEEVQGRERFIPRSAFSRGPSRGKLDVLEEDQGGDHESESVSEEPKSGLSVGRSPSL